MIEPNMCSLEYYIDFLEDYIDKKYVTDDKKIEAIKVLALINIAHQLKLNRR